MHERDIFGLKVYKNSHPDMRKIRRNQGNTALHGNKFWKASILLMDYLEEYPIFKGAHVLELGCGWGLAGMYCAKYSQANVTGLDADERVFEYVNYHAELNDVTIRQWKSRFEQVRIKDLSEFDIIIGTDICFWDTMTDTLYKLLGRAQRAGVSRVILTDPGRQPFHSLAEKVMTRYHAEYSNWSVAHPYNTSGFVLDIC